MWVKNASKDTSFRSAAGRATAAIGIRTFANFASWTFFSMTRLEPFSFTTRSSLGRLKAAVCTPRLASPAVKTMSMTRMGARAPRCGLRSEGSMGRWSSRSWSWALKRPSRAVKASSRRPTKASKAALALNQPSSYVSYGPIVGSIAASSSIQATSLA